MRPTIANRLIRQLRDLPLVGQAKPSGPIHAVCLSDTDAEEHRLHFSKLEASASASGAPSVAESNNTQIAKMFGSTQLINLVTAPDMGLGQPATGNGIFAGAIPSAGSIIKGLEEVTPQLVNVSNKWLFIFSDFIPDGRRICHWKVHLTKSYRRVSSYRSHVGINM